MLVSLFPAQAATLGAAYAEALAAVPDGRAKTGGIGAEVVEARIWGGVHYREADVQGVRSVTASPGTSWRTSSAAADRRHPAFPGALPAAAM